MAAEQELTSTQYIGHHLTNRTVSLGDGPFWTLHVDTLATAIALGVIGFGFLWWIVRGATAGVPNKRQAFVEVLFDFVDDQVRGIFHGNRAFVGPLAVTVFVWVLLMNAMDFIPVDLTAWFTTHVLGQHEWKPVPTSDVNTTFALALTVWGLMIFFNLKIKGVGGWLHELLCTPFGTKPALFSPLLVIFNLMFNLVEYISKPLSHALRLFGNIYAGEIIFLLLWLWAANSSWSNDYFLGGFFSVVLALFWALFHLLIVPLQAFIFMMLTVVYVAMAHESH